MDGMGRGNLVWGRIWPRRMGGCEGVEIWRWDGIKVGDFAVDSLRMGLDLGGRVFDLVR